MITKQVRIIDKIYFAIATSNADSKTCIMHIIIQKHKKIAIHSTRKTQVEVRILLFDETPTFVLVKYFNYHNVFLVKNMAELSEHTKISNYTIKLKKDKKPIFWPNL